MKPGHVASAVSVLFAAIAGSLWWASDDAADLRSGRFAPQGFIEPQAAGRMYLDSTAHEDLLSAGFFHARTLADGEQSLRIYTRLEPDSLLGIRASGTVGATAAEVISVLREVDLIPEWNRFCDFGICSGTISITNWLSPTDSTRKSRYFCGEVAYWT